VLLHHSVGQDTVCYRLETLVGIHSLLHRSLAVVFQVQNILGMPLKRNRILDIEDIGLDVVA